MCSSIADTRELLDIEEDEEMKLLAEEEASLAENGAAERILLLPDPNGKKNVVVRVVPEPVARAIYFRRLVSMTRYAERKDGASSD